MIVKLPIVTIMKQREWMHRLNASLRHRKVIYCALLTCLALQPSNAETTPFQKGTTAYEAGKYSEAIEWLEQAPESAAMRHNLALSYFQAEQPAEAVWQLERANRLAPINPEIAGKLQLLKQQLNLPQTTLRWDQILTRWLSLSQWLILSSVVFWLAIGCLWCIRPDSTTALKLSRLIGALCLCVLAIAAYCTGQSYFDTKSGIVIAEEPVDLRAAPANAAPAVSRLSPGESARVIEEHEAYLKVKSSTGAQGWLPAGQFKALYFN